MMDLYYIDYVSVSRKSWLHGIRAEAKMLVLAAVIVVLLSVQSLPLEVGIVFAALIAALSARLPMKIYLPLTLYPVIFLVVLYLSIEGLTLHTALVLGFRVLAVTASVVLFFLSTSYPVVFGVLGRFLPGFLVAALFFSYRSIFIISSSINNVRIAIHLRGGFNWRHPVSTLRHFGTALGHFLVHSIDTSVRIGDGLRLRGFKNRIYYLEGDK
jgi:energy-coupling factor transporter transmembrane protein EcfT